MTKKEELKKALEVIKEVAPSLYNLLKGGIHEINLDKMDDSDKIKSAVKIYLNAKNIVLAKKVVDLLVMYVKYDTSTESRAKISNEIKMSRGTINQNTTKLKTAGVIVYPYDDSKKSKIHPDLEKLKDFILVKEKNNILIKYGG